MMDVRRMHDQHLRNGVQDLAATSTSDTMHSHEECLPLHCQMNHNYDDDSDLPVIKKMSPHSSHPCLLLSYAWTTRGRTWFGGSMLTVVIMSLCMVIGSFHATRNTIMGQQQLLKKEQPHHHRSSTQHLSSISSKLQQRGWMQTIIDYRLELAKIANEMETLDESKTRQEEYKYQVRHYQNYTFDISPIYNVLRSAIDTVGVRGVIFDILNDEYDYFLYYPHSPQYDCFKSHGVGVDCTAFDTWWMYHFTGATIADHFLDSIRNGNRNNNEQEHDKRTGILWDGITNQRFTSMEGLIREIQKYQRLPYVNSASFHAQHAIIWQYLAQAYPDIQEYPSQLADTLCRSNADSGPRYARTVGKGIDHECYHGFGHAVFYVVAKRQMKLQQQQKRMIVNDPTVPSKNFPFPTTTPSISARLQVRPSSGFELTKEAMCQVYALCKGAIRSYDDKDKEDEYPYSKGVRVCLEGVVHSVRLFSDTRHNKKETVAYVMEEMHRCEKTTEKNGTPKETGQDVVLEK